MAKDKSSTVQIQTYADHHVITQPNPLRKVLRRVAEKDLDDPAHSRCNQSTEQCRLRCGSNEQLLPVCKPDPVDWAGPTPAREAEHGGEHDRRCGKDHEEHQARQWEQHPGHRPRKTVASFGGRGMVHG